MATSFWQMLPTIVLIQASVVVLRYVASVCLGYSEPLINPVKFRATNPSLPYQAIEIEPQPQHTPLTRFFASNHPIQPQADIISNLKDYATLRQVSSIPLIPQRN